MPHYLAPEYIGLLYWTAQFLNQTPLWWYCELQIEAHRNVSNVAYSFPRSLHTTRMSILPTSFCLCHSKFKRAIMSPTLKGDPFYQLTLNFTFMVEHLKIKIMKKTANIWEYKVGINAINANIVCLWKCWMENCASQNATDELTRR